MKTQDQTRRSFLKAAGQLTVLGGVITLGGCLGGCSTDSSSSFIIASTGVKATLVLANEPSLTNVGDSIRRVLGTNNNGRAVIVVHTADKKFRTMSTLCQHEGGSVQDPSSNQSICNLYQAQYSTAEGNFAQHIGGQSAPSLQTFTTEFDEATGTITITF